MKLTSFRKCLVGLTLTCASLTASAQYSDVYVFGDSLSDIGNLKAVTQNPSIPERFTNGPVAVEVVAAQLGFALTPSYHLLPFELTGGVLGNNYAVAGARATDEDGNEATPDINLPTQVNAFLQYHGGVAPSDALYILQVGGNDLRDARDIRATGVKGSKKEARKLIRAAVSAEKQQILKLIAAGVQNLVVLNAPDIGLIPDTDLVAAVALETAETKKQTRVANRLEKITRALSAKYNGRLARDIEEIEASTGLDIIEFDMFDFFSDQAENAEDYGLSNIDEPCVWAFSTQTVNSACVDFPVASGFMFWDEIHPTNVVHQNAAVNVLEMILTPR
jgi:outer membrane lipase/esterase